MPVFEFDRYINGELMAEGVVISRQLDLHSAARKAALLAACGPRGERPVLVLRTAPPASTEAALAHADRLTASPGDKWLAEIRERAEKATPGEWFEYSEPDCGYPPTIHCPNPGAAGHHPVWDDPYNLSFIAHARIDIPALLAHADALAREVERLTGLIAAAQPYRKKMEAAIAERDARLSALAEAAEEVRTNGRWSDGQWMIDKAVYDTLVDALLAIRSRPEGGVK